MEFIEKIRHSSRAWGTYIFLGIILFVLLISMPMYVVDPGWTAIHLRLGSMIKATNTPGWYVKIPLLDSVIFITNRIRKSEISTTSLSKDLQTVKTEVAINYRISEAIHFYKTVGLDFEDIILNPFSQESIKAITARFTAEDLIRCRDDVKRDVFKELKDRLDPIYIELIDFNFVHLDFTPEFIHAVENKQIAEQAAKTAHNLTAKIQEEAVQIKASADAEAYAMKVKKETVTKELALLKAIEKWNGVLPTFVGSSIPLMSLKN